MEEGAKRSRIKLSLLPDGLTSGGRVTFAGGAMAEESFFFLAQVLAGVWLESGNLKMEGKNHFIFRLFLLFIIIT